MGFLEQNEAAIVQGEALSGSYWSECPEQMLEVIDWVLNPQTVDTFETAIEAQINTSIADILTVTINKFYMFKKEARLLIS